MRLLSLLKILRLVLPYLDSKSFSRFFADLQLTEFCFACVCELREEYKTYFCAWVNHTRTETWNREGTPHREYLSLGQVRLGLYEQYNILQDG